MKKERLRKKGLEPQKSRDFFTSLDHWIQFDWSFDFYQHQQQVASAVERAKQVTMTELNAVIGVNISVPFLFIHFFSLFLHSKSPLWLCRLLARLNEGWAFPCLNRFISSALFNAFLYFCILFLGPFLICVTPVLHSTICSCVQRTDPSSMLLVSIFPIQSCEYRIPFSFLFRAERKN